MTKDEGLKLALEALEGVLDNSPKVLDASISGGLYEVVQCRDAITAIKEALAQPTSGYAKKIQELIQERDALRALVQDENAIRADEREACAKVCDDWPNGRDDVYLIGVAIRARGNT